MSYAYGDISTLFAKESQNWAEINIESLKTRIESYLKAVDSNELLNSEQAKYSSEFMSSIVKEKESQITELDMIKEGYALLENTIQVLTGREINYILEFENGEGRLFSLTLNLQQLLGAEEVKMLDGSSQKLNIVYRTRKDKALRIQNFAQGYYNKKTQQEINFSLAKRNPELFNKLLDTATEITGAQKQMYDTINQLSQNIKTKRKHLSKKDKEYIKNHPNKSWHEYIQYFKQYGTRRDKTWYDDLFFNVNKGHASEGARKYFELLEDKKKKNGIDLEEALLIREQHQQKLVTGDLYQDALNLYASMRNNDESWRKGDVGDFQYKNVTSGASINNLKQITDQLKHIVDILNQTNINDMRDSIQKYFVANENNIDNLIDLQAVKKVQEHIDKMELDIRNKKIIIPIKT